MPLLILFLHVIAVQSSFIQSIGKMQLFKNLVVLFLPCYNVHPAPRTF